MRILFLLWLSCASGSATTEPTSSQNSRPLKGINIRVSLSTVGRAIGKTNVGFGKRGLFRKVHFLEILENLEILEILENPQTVENKGKSDHCLEILEKLEILEIQEIPSVKRPLS